MSRWSAFRHNGASKNPDERGVPASRPAFARGLLPNSIQRRLLLLLLIVLIPVLAIQAGIYYSRFETRRSEELQANLELARSVALTFDAYVQDVRRQEAAIGVAITSPLTIDEINRLLESSARQYPSIRYFRWVDPRGFVVASNQKEAIGTPVDDFSYFRDVAQGKDWVISDLFVGPIAHKPTFVVAQGVRDKDGRLQGVVTGGIDPERLSEVLGMSRSGQGSIAIVDRQGLVVYQYPEGPMTWEQRNWIKSEPQLNRSLAGEELSQTFVSAIDDQMRMGAHAPIRSMGWVAEASRPQEVAMAPVVQKLALDSGLLLLVSVVAFAAALVISRHISVPVRRLREHALVFGRGEYGRRAEVAGPTEVGELAGAFNRMAEEIQSQHEELQAQNEELKSQSEEIQSQSEELQAQNEELHAVNLWLVEARRKAEEDGVRIRDLNTQLEAGALRLRAIIDQMPGGVVIADECARIVMTNRAAERLYGRPVPYGEDYSRRASLQIHYPDGRPYDPRDLPLTRSALDGETHTNVEFVIHRPDGQKYPMLAHSAPLRDTEGRITGAVGVFQDISPLKELDRLKDEFLTVAAHELKTPLTSLKGYAQIALRRMEGREGREAEIKALQVINNQTDRMSGLVNDLLDVSRIQGGRLTLQPKIVDLAGLTRTVVEQLQITTEKHSLFFTLAGSVKVVADADRTEQVLFNLINNAIKYSPRGGDVEIQIETKADVAAVTVKDHGIGIPKEKQAQLFARFYRAQSCSHARGMGLGLYISREIVKNLGGQMWVESEEGKGSTFGFTLPLAQAEPGGCHLAP